ncbi:hypothetical protein CSV74_00245 [Sporosarcina sp. P19]|uniref:hypothetical protein n=1 Tax=Sporosarcina sp. P19 TaxID=2048258 RepID=UPI000C166A6E|nr:hypothetical protein [Sporosarcina sp. P19]PIC77992.1 hypothetical protein CSV74_00245 [Sporosarcina sp. P19]
MSETTMIQQLYDQIDRLISMQSTMLSVVGVLFALIIAVFAFFQWRINNRDQDIIIKIAKEQLIESLINNYNLLDINENKNTLLKIVDRNERTFKENNDTVYELKVNSINLNYDLQSLSLRLQRYLILEEKILSTITSEDYIDNEIRDQILESIIDFKNSEGKHIELVQIMSHNLFNLLNLHSKEKMDKLSFDIESISKDNKEYV